MKRHIYKGTKRAVVLSVLNGKYTVYEAANIVRVTPTTVRRWLASSIAKEVLASMAVSKEEQS